MPRVVATWGVFDLLHSGHMSLLRRARKLGPRLIVGIDSDDRAEQAKGRRPLLCAEERKYQLLHLKCVNEVRIMDSPLSFIADLYARYGSGVHYVKGGDSKPPPAELLAIQTSGGSYGRIPIVFDRHTTDLVRNIVRSQSILDIFRILEVSVK